MDMSELIIVTNINRKIKMDQIRISSFSVRVYLLALFCHLHCCGTCLAAPLKEQLAHHDTLGKDNMSKLDELHNNANYVPDEIHHDESTNSFDSLVLVNNNPRVTIFPINEVK